MINTVVTAFYKIETSKHTYGEYLQWIDNFFKCVKSPVICFCQNDTYLQKYKSERVKIIERDFYSFKLTTLEWMETWNKNHQIDPEKLIHSPKLYAIWALKQEFVENAIKENPFSSEYFVWCDIGCFRCPENFTNPPTFANNIQDIIQNDEFLCLRINDQIGGGVLAGNIQAWTYFIDAYKRTLKIFEEKNMFIGKDQTLYKFMIENKMLNFKVLNSKTWGRNIKSLKFDSAWFYLTYIL